MSRQSSAGPVAVALRRGADGAAHGVELERLTGGRWHAGRVWRGVIRVAGAGLLLGMAWIHEDLYRTGYSTVPTIGPLFRINAILGVVLAAAVLLTPVAWWRWACAAGALLQVGTLLALVQSLTIGSFGFHESLNAPMIGRTFVVESLGFLVLAVGAMVHTGRDGHPERGERTERQVVDTT